MKEDKDPNINAIIGTVAASRLPSVDEARIIIMLKALVFHCAFLINSRQPSLQHERQVLDYAVICG